MAIFFVGNLKFKELNTHVPRKYITATSENHFVDLIYAMYFMETVYGKILGEKSLLK